jgi:chromosome segregation ATPase
MSDELDPLKKALEAVGGHLQDLQADQGHTVHLLSQTVLVTGELQHSVGELQRGVGELQRSVGDLYRRTGDLQDAVRNLQARAVSQEATMIALSGAFAGIDQILTRLLTDRLESQEQLRILKTDNEELRGAVSDLVRRVEALERRAS